MSRIRKTKKSFSAFNPASRKKRKLGKLLGSSGQTVNSALGILGRILSDVGVDSVKMRFG